MAKKSTGGGRGAGSGSRVRDAKTGQFVPRGTEKRRPSTTVVERIKPPKKGS